MQVLYHVPVFCTMYRYTVDWVVLLNAQGHAQNQQLDLSTPRKTPHTIRRCKTQDLKRQEEKKVDWKHMVIRLSICPHTLTISPVNHFFIRAIHPSIHSRSHPMVQYSRPHHTKKNTTSAPHPQDARAAKLHNCAFPSHSFPISVPLFPISSRRLLRR